MTLARCITIIIIIQCSALGEININAWAAYGGGGCVASRTCCCVRARSLLGVSSRFAVPPPRSQPPGRINFRGRPIPPPYAYAVPRPVSRDNLQGRPDLGRGGPQYHAGWEGSIFRKKSPRPVSFATHDRRNVFDFKRIGF